MKIFSKTVVLMMIMIMMMMMIKMIMIITTRKMTTVKKNCTSVCLPPMFPGPDCYWWSGVMNPHPTIHRLYPW